MKHESETECTSCDVSERIAVTLMKVTARCYFSRQLSSLALIVIQEYLDSSQMFAAYQQVKL